MAGINFSRAEFVRSAAAASQFIRSSQPAVVFAGKSNVGKSSVINRLLNRNNFARVGSTPGKTIHINYFLIDEKLYFVDLPGYGYANVPRSEKERWASLMEAFFTESGLMTLGVHIVDARHKPTEGDLQMVQWFQQSGCPFLVLANKLDKLKKSEIVKNLQLIRDTLALDEAVPLIPFSAETGQGREALINEIVKAI